MKRLLPIFSAIAVLLFLSPQSRAQFGSELPNNWQNVPKCLSGAVNAAAFSIGTKAYVIGGDTSGEYGVRKKYSKAVFCYDSTTNSWTELAEFPGKARIGAAAFAVNGIGYYGLGQDSTGYYHMDTFKTLTGKDTIGGVWQRRILSDWWKFDPTTKVWTQLKDFPYRARAFSSSFVLRDSDYNEYGGIAFGYAEQASQTNPPLVPTTGSDYLALLNMYDPATDTWTSRSLFGGGRSNATVIPGDNMKLYYGLGDRGVANEYLTDWWEFDADNETFAQKASFPSGEVPPKGRLNAGTFSYADYVYVVGGYRGTWTKTFYEFDGNTNTWQQYPDYIDTGRANGVSWMIGSMGYYGLGYGGKSQEFSTIAKYFVDTATIRLYADIPDTVCSKDIVSIPWSSGKFLNAGNKLRVQMSDSLGEFTWPPGQLSLIDSFPATGLNGVIHVPIPKYVDQGRQYKLRLISSDPPMTGRATQTFFVKQNPNFTYKYAEHPVVDTVCNYSNSFLPVFVTGTAFHEGELKFQWRRNGVPIPEGVSTIGGENVEYRGTRTDTLILIQTKPVMEGFYDCLVTGDCYPDSSVPYKIVVINIPPPALVFQPADTMSLDPNLRKRTNVCESSRYNLYVHATGNKLNYQWYRNGSIIPPLQTNIVGTTSSTLSFSSVYPQDSGWYRVRIYESCGAYIFSDSFYVNVLQFPRVIKDPVNASNVMIGDTSGFKVHATGYELKYRWKADNVPLSDGVRLRGTHTDSLTILNVNISDLAFYTVEISGGCPPDLTSNLAILDVVASPKIERQPKDTVEVCEGSSASVNILASGTNVAYQWKRNGQIISDMGGVYSGTNTRILNFNNVTQLQQGIFTCEVDNGVGTPVESNPTTLIVNPIPPKPNVQMFFDGSVSRLRSDITGDTYLWFFNGRHVPGYSVQAIIVPDSMIGDWTVRVIRKDCISPISDRFAFFASVDGAEHASPIRLYPNPAVNTVRFDIAGIGAESSADILVYDLTGRQVMRISNIREENIELNVASLNPGMYMVNIVAGDNLFSGKFIKH